ncbi:MAG: hypothetical protein ABEK36_03225 [Candidatus Aenigmatarchaeota archaeon]
MGILERYASDMKEEVEKYQNISFSTGDRLIWNKLSREELERQNQDNPLYNRIVVDAAKKFIREYLNQNPKF